MIPFYAFSLLFVCIFAIARQCDEIACFLRWRVRMRQISVFLGHQIRRERLGVDLSSFKLSKVLKETSTKTRIQLQNI